MKCLLNISQSQPSQNSPGFIHRMKKKTNENTYKEKSKYHHLYLQVGLFGISFRNGVK